MTWKPISSAPRDGSWVMLGIAGRKEILLAYWHRLHQAWWGQNGSTGEWEKWQKATHYQPLPEPPKETPDAS